MMKGPIPTTYEEWRHCISVEGGIPLTSDYIASRLGVWREEKTQETRRFRELYGDAYWRTIISWFERAEKEA